MKPTEHCCADVQAFCMAQPFDETLVHNGHPYAEILCDVVILVRRLARVCVSGLRRSALKVTLARTFCSSLADPTFVVCLAANQSSVATQIMFRIQRPTPSRSTFHENSMVFLEEAAKVRVVVASSPRPLGLSPTP
jgi:hypothetical protein